MSTHYDLSVSTSDISTLVGEKSIKRMMYHLMPLLSDYCKHPTHFIMEDISGDMESLIKFFEGTAMDDGVSILDYDTVRLLKVDFYETRLLFSTNT